MFGFLSSIRWARILKLLTAILVIGGGLYLSRLRIKVVQIEGNTQSSSQQIEKALLGDKSQANPLLFYFRATYGKQVQLPYVDHYTVTLRGIDSVKIEIHEKQLIGYLDAAGNCLYFDKTGTIVETSVSPRTDIPRVTGLSVDNTAVGERIPNAEDSIFILLDTITGFLQKRTILVEGRSASLVQVIDQLQISDAEEVTCVFGDISVYMGGRRDMEEKLLEMADILPRLAGRRGTLYLDTYKSTEAHPAYRFVDIDRLAQIEADRQAAAAAPNGAFEFLTPGMETSESVPSGSEEAPVLPELPEDAVSEEAAEGAGD